MDLMAQISWSHRAGEGGIWTMMLVGFFIGMALMFIISRAPTRARRPIVGAFTFLSGLFYVMLYLWPTPKSKGQFDIPQGPVESVGFFLQDTVPVVKDFASILTAFLLGLGVFSLLRIHLSRVFKGHKDRFFSATLLVSMVLMMIVGYSQWYQREFTTAAKTTDYGNPDNWTSAMFAFDFLFDGLLQQMDAAMFSIIAFFILSAAYRAFRIRSVEATIMLGTALILMLSLMGLVDYLSTTAVASLGGDQNVLQNFTLKSVSDWIKNNLQSPSLRAMEFGVGLGALAMGLRLWLNLERGGVGG